MPWFKSATLTNTHNLCGRSSLRLQGWWGGQLAASRRQRGLHYSWRDMRGQHTRAAALPSPEARAHRARRGPWLRHGRTAPSAAGRGGRASPRDPRRACSGEPGLLGRTLRASRPAQDPARRLGDGRLLPAPRAARFPGHPRATRRPRAERAGGRAGLERERGKGGAGRGRERERKRKRWRERENNGCRVIIASGDNGGRAPRGRLGVPGPGPRSGPVPGQKPAV